MGLFKEFKDFASRGNVIDLAVGVIIGGAFGKIVSSLVNDLLMPIIGMLLNGINFKEWKFVLKEAVLGADGKVINPEVSLFIGNFIQNTIDFLIIAFVIFLFIKGINSLKKKEPVPEPEPEKPSEEILLLSEIRDLLKK